MPPFLSSRRAAWHRLLAARAHRGMRWARPSYTEPVRRWLVLQDGPNPSTDYYIRPRAAAAGVPAVYRDRGRDRPTAEDLSPGTQVFIVRYLDAEWARALRERARARAGVVYFMDDDLMNPLAWDGLPDRYVAKLAKHYTAVGREIAALASRLWVSTPALAGRYENLGAEVFPPLPLVDDVAREPAPIDGMVRVFYHGSQSHDAEIRWLRPIVDEVLKACPSVHFEIIGDHAVNVLYRGLPRTRVLHPMSWPNYVAHCRSMTGHIGLVPLLDAAHNEVRSHTKVFDILRCGGAGVFSATGPYPAAVTHGTEGWLLESDPVQWTQAIVRLTTGTRGTIGDLRAAAQKRWFNERRAIYAAAS